MKVFVVSGINKEDDRAPRVMNPVQFVKVEDAVLLIKAACRVGYSIYVDYLEALPEQKIIDLD